MLALVSTAHESDPDEVDKEIADEEERAKERRRNVLGCTFIFLLFALPIGFVYYIFANLPQLPSH